jgi:thiol:disulfide interchange protein DsbA
VKLPALTGGACGERAGQGGNVLRKKLSLLISVLGMLLVPISGTPAETSENIFSCGSGPIEVFIFTDYFCPPCQAIEPYLENALTDLHRLGVRVTFVDKPIYARTPMYSRYFLYAAKAANSFDEVLRIRRVLFDIAKTKAVDSERELIQKLKENNIKLVPMEVKPIFDRWAELIERFGIKSTPICIVKQPGQKMMIYIGSRKIPEGIDLLLKQLSGVP